MAEKKTYGNKPKSKFNTTGRGYLTTLQGDKFVNVGGITVGQDDQDRDRVIINVTCPNCAHAITCGGFVNPPLTDEQKAKIAEIRKNG